MKFIFIFLLLAQASQAAVPEEFFHDLAKAKTSGAALIYAQEKQVAAKARSWNKALAWTPSVSLQLGRIKTSLNGVATDQPTFWEASANWNLFKSGADLYQFRSALAAERSQEFSRLSEELKLERLAAQAIFKSLYLREAELSQSKQLRLKEEGLRIAKNRYDQGKISLQELTKIEVDLSQQKNQLRGAQIEVAENQVEVLGYLREQPATRSWPLSLQQTIILPGARDLSPSTKSQQEAALAKEFAWKSAKLLHLPSLDFAFAYGEKPLRTRAEKTWTAGLYLNIPIWSRWNTSADAAEYYAEFIGADRLADEQKIKNEAELVFLQNKIQLSRENLQEAEWNVRRAEKLYADMLVSFRLGRISANDLFIEQNRLIESEYNLSQSRWTYHSTVMDVCSLSGVVANLCLR